LEFSQYGLVTSKMFFEGFDYFYLQR